MPLNINFQQIFLHFLNFTLLFAGLYFLLYKPVRAFMSKRDAYYADLDRQAQEKLAQAEELHHRYEEQIAGAREEIQAKSDQALQDAMETAQQQLLQAQTVASHIGRRPRRSGNVFSGRPGPRSPRWSPWRQASCSPRIPPRPMTSS